jgi:aryl-alcohol dehydrogenase-like predicted oxidoreductase
VARLIVGGWQLAADHGAGHDRETVLGELEALVDAGLTTFDCADIYTGVEDLLGELLRRVGPGRVQVHTKYVPDRSRLAGLGAAEVRAAVDRSLVRLGVERLDLVQLHWWDWEVPGWLEAAAELDRLRAEGKIRCLGVTNTDVPHLVALLDAGLPIVSNQVQYSLLDRRPEHGMGALCTARGVHLLSYGSLAGGFLSDQWLGAPEPAEPLANRSLVKYRLILEEAGDWELVQRLLAAVGAVARAHGADVAAAAVRWVLDRPAVAAAIVGAGIRSRPGTLEGIRRTVWDEAANERIDRILAAGRGGPAGDVYELERIPGGGHASILRTELHREEERT